MKALYLGFCVTLGRKVYLSPTLWRYGNNTLHLTLPLTHHHASWHVIRPRRGFYFTTYTLTETGPRGPTRDIVPPTHSDISGQNTSFAAADPAGYPGELHDDVAALNHPHTHNTKRMAQFQNIPWGHVTPYSHGVYVTQMMQCLMHRSEHRQNLPSNWPRCNILCFQE